MCLIGNALIVFTTQYSDQQLSTHQQRPQGNVCLAALAVALTARAQLSMSPVCLPIRRAPMLISHHIHTRWSATVALPVSLFSVFCLAFTCSAAAPHLLFFSLRLESHFPHVSCLDVRERSVGGRPLPGWTSLFPFAGMMGRYNH